MVWDPMLLETRLSNRIFLWRVNRNNFQVKGQAILSTEKDDVKVRKIVLTVSGEQKLTVNFVEYSNSEDGEDVWNTAENVKYWNQFEIQY